MRIAICHSASRHNIFTYFPDQRGITTDIILNESESNLTPINHELAAQLYKVVTETEIRYFISLTCIGIHWHCIALVNCDWRHVRYASSDIKCIYSPELLALPSCYEAPWCMTWCLLLINLQLKTFRGRKTGRISVAEISIVDLETRNSDYW